MNSHQNSSKHSIRYSKCAAILAIGTEVTSGQINNTHPQWIAKKLDDYGIDTALHMSVQDDLEEIVNALAYCQSHCEYLFLTGGLGPTSDDLTRQAVAKWLNTTLELNESEWEGVQKKLQTRGVTLREAHKQQCHFPKGAKTLSNSVGTAAGFFIEQSESKIWVLPGPPNELQAIWNDHIQDQLGRMSLAKTTELKKWKIIGKPESDVANTVEGIFGSTGMTVGYRLTSPYVEVKVWKPLDFDKAHFHELVEKLEAAFSGFVLCRDEEDLAQTFLNLLPHDQTVFILDGITPGIFSERLFFAMRAHKKVLKNLSVMTSPSPLDKQSERSHTLINVTPSDSHSSWNLEFVSSQNSTRQKLVLPSQTQLYTERGYRMMVELTLYNLISILNEPSRT